MKRHMNGMIRTLAAAACLLVWAGIASGGTDTLPGGDSGKSKTFSATKGGRLVVAVDGGDITIIPTDAGQVSINVTGDDDNDFQDLRMTQSGNTVRIQNEASCGMCDLRYEVKVPTQFDIDLRTSEGNIEIQAGLTGTMNGRTSAGNIKVGNGGGSMDMSTSGGNIRIGSFKGDVNLRTSGGNLALGTVDGTADISTSGGDIRVENVGKTLSAHTSGGDVQVGDVGGEANVSTSGGSIVIGKVGGKATMSTAGGDIEVASASGIVSAKTAGGNLELNDITGSITAKTAGGDINASLSPSGKGKSKLVTAAGEIRLYIPENAKATINARIRVSGGGWHHRDDEEDYHIRSDFKADKTDKTEKSEDDDDITATYTLNGGGESIVLETSNADIIIRKGTGDQNHPKGSKDKK